MPRQRARPLAPHSPVAFSAPENDRSNGLSQAVSKSPKPAARTWFAYVSGRAQTGHWSRLVMLRSQPAKQTLDETAALHCLRMITLGTENIIRIRFNLYPTCSASRSPRGA